MSKLKLFIENFLVYGLGGIISKLVPLIMVPIITRLMPDSSYYGISDLSNTIVQFGSALAVMGVYDAKRIKKVSVLLRCYLQLVRH